MKNRIFFFRYTYIYSMSVGQYLQEIIAPTPANMAFREMMWPYIKTLETILSNKFCKQIRQLEFDLNLIEVCKTVACTARKIQIVFPLLFASFAPNFDVDVIFLAMS